MNFIERKGVRKWAIKFKKVLRKSGKLGNFLILFFKLYLLKYLIGGNNGKFKEF